MVADNFADATPVYSDGVNQWRSETYSTVGLSVESGEPGGGYRSAWWAYTPVEPGDVSMFNTPFEYDATITIYTGSTLGTLVEVTSGAGSAAFTATANTTYHIRVAQPDDTDNALRLLLHGPNSEPQFTMHSGGIYLAGSGDLSPPPIFLPWRILLVTGHPPAVNEPPPPPPPVELPTGALSLASTAGVARARLVLTAPAAGATVPLTAPSFILGVQALDLVDGDIVTAQVQYSTSSTFTSPLSLLGYPDISLGLAPLRLTGAATTGTLYWRARALINDEPVTDWTATRTLTLSPASGEAATALSWTVDPDAVPTPHLWFTSPAAGIPGDTVTVIGQGFPDPAHVTLVATTAPLQSRAAVPASTIPTDDWVIDPDTATADPEHDRLTVLVPAVPAPGGPIFVAEGAA